MKEIRLNKLTLKDFQGGNFTFTPNGHDASVHGMNTSGKTRLVSAFSWLLFNKDALGRSDFQLKNLDAKGESAHGLEHSVEAILLVNDKPITLKKVFKEKWTKKRGAAKSEFTGHTTEYFVDGVPLTEKDFIYKVSQIAGDESRFRLLTSPTTFPALHWQKQRALLLEVCGDISGQDVIASSEKLSGLPGILSGRSLDDHRKVVTSRRTEINKEMEKIPVRIDEVRRSLPDITGIDRKASETEAQRLETALNDAKLRLQGVNTGGNVAELTRTLSAVNADIRKLEDGHRSASLSTLNRLNQEISEIGVSVAAMRRKISFSEGETESKEKAIKYTDDNLSRLRTQWTAIDSEIFKDPTSSVCAACGQPLPEEKVKAVRDAALSIFNGTKAERLGEINRKGKDLKDQRDRLMGEIDALRKEIVIITDDSLPEAESKMRTLTDDRDSLKASSEDFKGIPGRDDLLRQVEEIEAEIKAERDGKAQDREKLGMEAALLADKLAGFTTQINKFTAREQGEKRIEELKGEEKKLAKEFEKLESEMFLMDLFIRTKVSLLTSKINEKFETVRFKLFDVQVNGGISETCQITVNGVPFDGGLNNGARINAGLEIVKVLQQHYQTKAPVFADNAEAVNTLFNVGSQMIRLFVSEDRTLRIEIAKQGGK